MFVRTLRIVLVSCIACRIAGSISIEGNLLPTQRNNLLLEVPYIFAYQNGPGSCAEVECTHGRADLSSQNEGCLPKDQVIADGYQEMHLVESLGLQACDIPVSTYHFAPKSSFGKSEHLCVVGILLIFHIQLQLEWSVGSEGSLSQKDVRRRDEGTRLKIRGTGKTLGSKKARRHAHFKPSQRLL